ncbi:MULTISPECIES: DNA topoisomerase IB [unclassified Psychrobacter]|uniref:DNA topoisomerase IB n=1 Tax=unclassified Psychrobacter TaxID=196806 RepID=UPI0025B2E089|nr:MULTISPECIES: DNA topoisomerase IB [unclassified Psychrobacter]MDN3454635.1 DNA topoisomerase IB [Psychrobacter sp. APC 3350]MDN3503902.1 DNA topoisomerase IB [Psychrobacter sp. 5A.1]
MAKPNHQTDKAVDVRHNYEHLARLANLRYVSDDEPGYERRRWGRGFTYKDATGNTVKDKALRKRFDALVIPPMWSNVWICQDETGHLQSTGRDDKARKQYLYHPEWDRVRDRAKFDAMIGFAEALPNLRAQVELDLDAKPLSRVNVLAAVVKLLETTLIRIGNSRYAKLNKSYGLSTLRSKHVSETDNGLAFDFVGKSAKEHHIELQDERLTDIVQACSELPGYQIFKYLDDNGHKQVVDSSDINDYLRMHTCGIDCESKLYSAKDFRTWMASVLAASYLYDELQTTAGANILASAAESPERQQLVINMVKSVAAELGNTPTVCRASYIHPIVIERFLAGQFFETYKQARRGRTKKYQSCEEKALLGFLRTDV